MKFLTFAIPAAAMMLMATQPSRADLIINPNGNAGGEQATPETPLNGGPGFPCGGCTTNNVTTYGYTSTATLVADVTGWYRFTFEGAGNAANTNTFSSTGGTFTAVGAGGTGAGSTPNGTSFKEFLTAGTVVPFTLTSTVGSRLSCSISDGSGPTPSSGCDYLIALANSPTSPGAYNVSQPTAWIGFSDSPPPDSDFQDMVVRVDEIPEPTSLALLGAGLAGLGLSLARRRKAN